MTLKTILGYAILIIIVGALSFLVIIQQSNWMELQAEEEAEALELKINESYANGYNSGLANGMADVLINAYKNGVYTINVDNQSYALYSPQGCIDAIQEANQ